MDSSLSSHIELGFLFFLTGVAVPLASVLELFVPESKEFCSTTSIWESSENCFPVYNERDAPLFYNIKTEFINFDHKLHICLPDIRIPRTRRRIDGDSWCCAK